ncbi:Flowering-promoting factor 1-like protein 1 [Acorus gramineus]|uniref:Flowering-promoting factor 1-like protein 1 n=1 Tax=Acorus gramineus TaxID=55184 RepID=A0AAV9B2P0_ACOGR|nr:Flowering-promoting factor 1-like protein 1 [Acorus gramineus]
MSGVWVFKHGVARLISRPTREELERSEAELEALKGQPKRVLVHVPSEQTITCYEDLERRLVELGWERYNNNNDLIQFHRSSSSVHLISLPKNFSDFKSTHMYDIVVKNRHSFRVVVKQ